MTASVHAASRRRSRLRAYAAIAATSARHELVAAHAWLARLVFYLAILLVFSQLWRVVFAEKLVAGFSAASFVWYLALTEWAMLAAPAVFLEIEADVRSGDFVHRLPRPVSYLGSKLAEALGALGLRLLILGVGGTALAILVAGGLPSNPSSLAWAIPLGFLAAIVQVMILTCVGLAALWIHDVGPVYWIWQKGAFLLGGLMLPLEIYPDWVRAVAYWTPFAPILHGVGRMAFGVDAGTVFEVALLLVAWGGVAALSLAWLYRRGLRQLEAGGG